MNGIYNGLIFEFFASYDPEVSEHGFDVYKYNDHHPNSTLILDPSNLGGNVKNLQENYKINFMVEICQFFKKYDPKFRQISKC